MNYEVIVVGAGPSGSTAAKILAEKGIKVLLLDKENFPRNKPCGGGLPLRTLTDFPYIKKLHKPRGLMGSSNQEYIFTTSKYSIEDLLNVPSAEIIFEKGEMKITGIDTKHVKSWIK